MIFQWAIGIFHLPSNETEEEARLRRASWETRLPPQAGKPVGKPAGKLGKRRAGVK